MWKAFQSKEMFKEWERYRALLEHLAPHWPPPPDFILSLPLNKNKKLQHLAIQCCIQIGCQCSLYLCSRLHVKAVPTLLSLLRRGTKASCPSSLRRPSEKAGKEKVTGPTAAEVVAESCWTAPWAAASGGWRSRTRTSRRRRSGMVLRSSSRSSRNCRKHLKQRSWVKAETRRHSTFCMSSPQSREHQTNWKPNGASSKPTGKQLRNVIVECFDHSVDHLRSHHTPRVL